MLDLKKIEQIAIATDDYMEVLNNFIALGLYSWKQDEVVATGKVFGEEGTNRAVLNFNYDLGVELEVLEYKEGANWHQKRIKEGAKFPFLSHIGYHVTAEELEVIRKKLANIGIEVAQEVFTDSHTNAYLLKKKRKFQYVVFDSKDRFGFDLKLIVRRENEKQ